MREMAGRIEIILRSVCDELVKPIDADSRV